jgi:hypothetical protein
VAHAATEGKEPSFDAYFLAFATIRKNQTMSQREYHIVVLGSGKLVARDQQLEHD